MENDFAMPNVCLWSQGVSCVIGFHGLSACSFVIQEGTVSPFQLSASSFIFQQVLERNRPTASFQCQFLKDLWLALF